MCLISAGSRLHQNPGKWLVKEMRVWLLTIEKSRNLHTNNSTVKRTWDKNVGYKKCVFDFYYEGKAWKIKIFMVVIAKHQRNAYGVILYYSAFISGRLGQATVALLRIWTCFIIILYLLKANGFAYSILSLLISKLVQC